METRLLNCPFCGGTAKYDERDDSAVYVCCISCDVATSVWLSEKASGADQAREAWNRRAPRFTPEERAALEVAIFNLDRIENPEERAIIRAMLDGEGT